MAARERLICASEEVVEGGDGVRFEVSRHGERVPAFAIRYAGTVRGFLNRCAHVPVELDWLPGKFFDLTGHYLICAVHGAHYSPLSGRCELGPCKGASLIPLPLLERDGQLFLIDEEAGAPVIGVSRRE